MAKSCMLKGENHICVSGKNKQQHFARGVAMRVNAANPTTRTLESTTLVYVADLQY